MQMGSLSRRTFLAGISLLCGGAHRRASGAARYETPYKYGKLVLAANQDKTAFDSRFVDCPFVFFHQDRFYMAHVGFDGTGYQTGLAESEDLVNWNKLGCIIPRDPSHPVWKYNVAMNWILRENDLYSAGRLKKVNGRHLGVFHAYPDPGFESGPAVIGLCWSDDLMRWEFGEVILRPEDGAPWEQGGLYKPCLVEHKGTYYLFYNAKTRNLPREQGGGWREQTGVAISTDLKHWRRYENNPIIANGPKGSWDERFASDPCVLLDGDTWLFFYFGLDGKGKARELLAAGADPFHPVKIDKILIDVGPEGSVDSVYAHKPSLVAHRGALYHFYTAVSGKWPNDVRGISVARSKPWE